MIKHTGLVDWVNEVALLCQPDSVHWCDGSQDEYQRMLRLMVQAGTAIQMSDSTRPTKGIRSRLGTATSHPGIIGRATLCTGTFRNHDSPGVVVTT